MEVRTVGGTRVRIDPSFRELLRPLGPHERGHLKELLRTDGRCVSDLIAAVIRDEPGLPILIDGHHRLELVAEVRAEGGTVEEPTVFLKEFASRFEAADYVARLQGGRRNWEAQDRIRFIVEKLDFVRRLKADAVKRQRSGRRRAGTEVSQGRVAYQLAALANTSPTTVKQVMKVLESGNSGVIAKLFDPDPKRRIAIAEAAQLVASAQKAESIRARMDRLSTWVLAPLRAGSLLDTIICADALEGLRLLPEQSVQLTVTSPPYAVHGVEYDNHEYDGDYSRYLDWLKRVLAEVYRVTVNGGRIVLNLDASNERDAQRQRANGIVHNVYADVGQRMSEIGWLFRGDHCLYKQSSVGTRPAWGSYARCSDPRIRRNHEYLLVFQKGNGPLTGDPTLCDLTQDEFERFTLSHWYIKPQRTFDPSHPDYHPVPFPEELVYRCAKLYSYVGSTTLDPFVGSGTTAFVAKALKRRYIGIDKSPLYCASAERRLKALDALGSRQWVHAIRRFGVGENERSDGYGQMGEDSIRARAKKRVKLSRLV